MTTLNSKDSSTKTPIPLPIPTFTTSTTSNFLALPLNSFLFQNGSNTQIPNAVAVPLPLSVTLPQPLQCPSKTDDINKQLVERTEQLKFAQLAYWTLREKFEQIESKSNSHSKKKAKSTLFSKSQLNPICEEETIDNKIEKLQRRLSETETQLTQSQQTTEKLTNQINLLQNENKDLINKLNQLKSDKFEANNQSKNYEKELRNLRFKCKKLEKEQKENKKLIASQKMELERKEFTTDTANQLYLNSNRVKEFRSMIKKYGESYATLKKRQTNLTLCVGKEDAETMKIRMNDLYHDICQTEQVYHSLYESLDVMHTESMGKELEVMTKGQEEIARLKEERECQSSHLKEYVQKNQTLLNDLTDREMKLRQKHNEISFLKQNMDRVQQQNTSLMEMNNMLQSQLQVLQQQNAANMNAIPFVNQQINNFGYYNGNYHVQ